MMVINIEVRDSSYNSIDNYDEVLFFNKNISRPKLIKINIRYPWALKIE